MTERTRATRRANTRRVDTRRANAPLRPKGLPLGNGKGARRPVKTGVNCNACILVRICEARYTGECE